MTQTQTFGPYTPVRQAGNLYFVSGQVGVEPDSKTTPADIAGQTHQTLKNMAAALQAVGLHMDQVVKTTIYLTDMGDFPAVNDIYTGYFTEPRPARSTVAVVELPRVAGDVRLRIEMDAVVDSTANTLSEKT